MTLYRILLLLYPAGFRAQYGDELTSVFRSRMRDASSVAARLALWIETVTDVLLTATQTHWEILLRDVRYTLRTLRRSPGFTLTAILVTALGVGATTAAFTITDHVLLRSLPFPDIDRLVLLWEDMSPGNYKTMEPSPANYRDWKRMSKSFSAVAASRPLSVGMTGVGDPQQIEGSSVTADLFPLLAAQPLFGRIFSPSDDRAGSPGTIILSYGTWQARFAADPSVLGRTILLDGEPFSIIGVMNKNFTYPRQDVELWTAMRFTNDDFEDRSNNYLRVLAKLRPGVSRGQAQAEMQIISQRLKRLYPKDNEHVGVTIAPLGGQVSERSRLMLVALLGAGLCVLLIACTNLANLLLGRALVRRKEISIRTALGAGREQLIRQMLTESVLLSMGGGALGIGIAALSVPLLSKLVPDSLPISATPSVDERVLVFALVLTLVTGICFGVFPAAQAAPGAAGSGLAEGSRSGVGGRREHLRRTLVIAEVAISFALLISCGLLIRALWHLGQIDPGFRAADVLTMRTVLPMPRYQSTAKRIRFYDHVLPAIRRIPGVKDAAYTSFLPIAMQGGIWPVAIAGQEPRLDRAFHQASLRFVTPGYFKTLGIPLLQGRDIRESDTNQSQYVAVVSSSFAREYWPGQSPIGQHFTFGFADRRVVGTAANVRVRGLERESEPQVYLSYKQVPDDSIVWYAPKDLAIRSSLRTNELLPAVRHIIGEADPELPVSDVQTLSTIVAEDTAPRLTQVRVLGGFAVIAILLAGIGIHGLLSFNISQRSQEIGVRMAIGAQPSDILGMVLKETAALAVAGLVLGFVLAYAAGHGISALLAGVSPNDALTYVAGVSLAIGIAAVGSFFPALRALRVDPITAIRVE